MTCIAAVKKNGVVWMGADSAGVVLDTGSLTVRSDPKVFIKGDFIFGFTTSFRMGQLLKYSLNIPEKKEKEEDLQYLNISFVDAVRECLGTGGFMTTREGVEQAGNFLFGYKGELYQYMGDNQIEISSDNYSSCGSGAESARGALAAIFEFNPDTSPEDAIEKSLTIASKQNAFVRGPFNIISL